MIQLPDFVTLFLLSYVTADITLHVRKIIIARRARKSQETTHRSVITKA